MSLTVIVELSIIPKDFLAHASYKIWGYVIMYISAYRLYFFFLNLWGGISL